MSATVDVSTDPARAAAEAFVELTRSREHTHVAVSGGSTPRTLFRLLATEFKDRVDWERVSLFQVDERCVAPDHDDANWKLLQDELLSRVLDLRAFRMEASEKEGDDAYAELIRRYVPHANGTPVFDLVLLGMGADGHTASLFPDTPALNETHRTVVFNSVPQVGARRMTLTYTVLEAAARRWFLVRGADKASAFAAVMRGELPAGRLAKATWYIDSDVQG
jgi:6-phosphogluconolactonase